MKKNSVTALLLCAVGSINGQESVNTASGEAIGVVGSASYTFGQVVYSSPTDYSNSETQGIQQPYEVYDVLEKDTIMDSNLFLSTSPNPTTDVVNLEIGNYSNQNVSYELVSLSGRIIESKKITESNTPIGMKQLAQGTYILRVMNDSFAIKTFKIIKN